jgi:hypothetical protein
MESRSVECFGSDPRVQGVRVEISSKESFVLGHNHFLFSELKAGANREELRIAFVTHVVLIEGYLLRRIESSIQTKELAWLVARSERLYSPANEKAFITKLTVNAVDSEPDQKRADQAGAESRY